MGLSKLEVWEQGKNWLQQKWPWVTPHLWQPRDRYAPYPPFKIDVRVEWPNVNYKKLITTLGMEAVPAYQSWAFVLLKYQGAGRFDFVTCGLGSHCKWEPYKSNRQGEPVDWATPSKLLTWDMDDLEAYVKNKIGVAA